MLLGKPLGDVSARRRVGFLPENPAYYHRSARETLAMSGSLNGVREPELSHRAAELLAALGLQAEAESNVGKFSRGMLQRVGMAQTLINDPDLLILDEPTSALDPISRLQVRQLLLETRNRGKSVFLSSHQLSEIELICDRVFFVQAGRVIVAGGTNELLQSSESCEITAANIDRLPASATDIRRSANRTSFAVPISEQRKFIEQIWAAGGTLISVSPKTKSLEEVFIDVMNGGSPGARGAER
jgi:ABC-2 type transport system ATP-binding protein